MDLLESLKAVIQDRDRALDHGAVLQFIDIAGVNRVREVADLRTRTLARDTLAIDALLEVIFIDKSTCVLHP